jgi:hypothetical protein
MPEHAAVDGYLPFGQIARSLAATADTTTKALRMGKLWS